VRISPCVLFTYGVELCKTFAKAAIIIAKEKKRMIIKAGRFGYRLAKAVFNLTAVKRKKQRHFRFFGALKFESVQTFASVKFV